MLGRRRLHGRGLERKPGAPERCRAAAVSAGATASLETVLLAAWPPRLFTGGVRARTLAPAAAPGGRSELPRLTKGPREIDNHATEVQVLPRQVAVIQSFSA